MAARKDQQSIREKFGLPRGKMQVVRFSCPSDVVRKLDKKMFELTYPNPEENSKREKFDNRSQMIEFIATAVANCSDKEFYLFKHLMNPYYEVLKK